MEVKMSDLTNWLLDSHIPSIRYLTLSRLLGRPEDDPAVAAARAAIANEGPVPVIMAKQTDTGQWADEHSFYTPKYVSTHWSMMLLAELAADGNDPRFRRGVEFMLDAAPKWRWVSLDEKGYGWGCLWGNIQRYAAQGGHGDDPRVQAIAEYLARDLQNGDGHCIHNGSLPCAWGVARALWGLAALPPDKRSPTVQDGIQRGITFLLDKFQLVQADYPTSGKISSLWFALNFPLFYQTDILFVLRVLAELGALDHPKAQAALEWLAAKRKADGHWKGSSPYRSCTWKAVGGAQEIDRWVSLHAALILQAAGMEVQAA
jgi:hypothetical protein